MDKNEFMNEVGKQAEAVEPKLSKGCIDYVIIVESTLPRTVSIYDCEVNLPRKRHKTNIDGCYGVRRKIKSNLLRNYRNGFNYLVKRNFMQREGRK